MAGKHDPARAAIADLAHNLELVKLALVTLRSQEHGKASDARIFGVEIKQARTVIHFVDLNWEEAMRLCLIWRAARISVIVITHVQIIRMLGLAQVAIVERLDQRLRASVLALQAVQVENSVDNADHVLLQQP